MQTGPPGMPSVGLAKDGGRGPTLLPGRGRPGSREDTQAGSAGARPSAVTGPSAAAKPMADKMADRAWSTPLQRERSSRFCGSELARDRARPELRASSLPQPATEKWSFASLAPPNKRTGVSALHLLLHHSGFIERPQSLAPRKAHQGRPYGAPKERPDNHLNLGCPAG